MKLPTNMNVLPKRTFHAKVGWKVERFFKDPKAIALCRAIEANNIPEMERLIAAGADVDAKGEGNMTPLMWALPDNKFERFECLLKRGANPNVAITTDLGAPKAFEIGDSVTFCTAKSHFPQHFAAVLQAGGDPTLCNGKGRCVMNELARGVPNASERIRLAMKHGGDINNIDTSGFTPIIEAMLTFRQYDLVLEMLELGADPSVRDNNRNRHLLHRILGDEKHGQHTMTEQQRSSLAKVRKWLEDHGYDFDAADKEMMKNKWKGGPSPLELNK